jgi:hypothetical protein
LISGGTGTRHARVFLSFVHVAAEICERQFHNEPNQILSLGRRAFSMQLRQAFFRGARIPACIPFCSSMDSDLWWLQFSQELLVLLEILIVLLYQSVEAR